MYPFIQPTPDKDHLPISNDSFSGLYRRGLAGYFDEDETPSDHFCDSLNIQFYGQFFGTRFGLNKTFTLANIVRTWPYLRIGEAARLIILDSTGKFFDSTNLVTPILTIAAAKDFTAVPFFNRLFISPNDGTKGLAGDFVYIYDGTTARAACGAAPVGVVTCADSGLAGNISAGTHLISVAYETNTGYITQPSAVTVYTAPGGKKLAVTNIPTGPAYVSARRLISTQAIVYNGNALGYLSFFIPNGRIPDNVSTTLTVNFFDTDLSNSADYLLDELTSIPAALVVGKYGSRLVSLGENGNQGVMRVSGIGDPESISSTSGFLVVDPTQAGGLTNCIEQRGLLYIFKGTSSYSTLDNQSNPNTWKVDPVDLGLGTRSPFGVSQIFDNRGANLDVFFVADIGGLYGYIGIFVKPELTFKVQEIWSRINLLKFNLVQVINDPQNKVVYVSLPLDGANTCNYILVGDYVQGLNYQDIRWSLWNFASNVASICLSINSATNLAYLQVALVAGNVYSLLSTQASDDGTAINNFARLALLSPKQTAGWIHHFNEIKGRIIGSGTLTVTATGLDGSNSTPGTSITLSATPGHEVLSKFNFQNERCSVKIGTNGVTAWFKAKSLTVYAKALWNNLPF